MRLPFIQHTLHSVCTAAHFYTTAPERNWRSNLLHLIACFSVSLVLGCLLFVGFLFSLGCDVLLSMCITCCCSVLLTIVLFLSKHARCFTALLLLSCGMKQCRNLLITIGTGLVVFWNVENTLRNLEGLARSLICNLERKRVSVDVTPLGDYIRMLVWVARQLQQFTDLGVVKFSITYHVDSSVDSTDLEMKLREAEWQLNATAWRVHAAVSSVSSLGQHVGPILGLILLGVSTVLFLRRYLCDLRFHNTFITSRFVHYDMQQRAQGKPTVLPLSKRETRCYSSIPSYRLTLQECKASVKFCIPVLTNMLMWVLFLGIDALFYWLLIIIKTHLEDLEPFHVPLIVNITEEGRMLNMPVQVSSSSRNFSYSVTLFEKECLPQPSLLLSQSAPALGAILTLLIALALSSGKLLQLRLCVADRFYSHSSQERVQHLHSHILHRRRRRQPQGHKLSVWSLLRKGSFCFPIFYQQTKGAYEEPDIQLPKIH